MRPIENKTVQGKVFGITQWIFKYTIIVAKIDMLAVLLYYHHKPALQAQSMCVCSQSEKEFFLVT